MVLPHLHDIAGKFMSHNGRMLCHIIVNPLVLRSQNGTFVGRHADAVRHYLYQNLILFDLRELEFLKPQIICRVQSYSFCSHKKCSFLNFNAVVSLLQQQNC